MISLMNVMILSNHFSLERENIIQNNCEFDILRIKKSEGNNRINRLFIFFRIFIGMYNFKNLIKRKRT